MDWFTVTWFYLGNHGVIALQAKNAEDAMRSCFYWHNPEFREKALVFVNLGKPIAVHFPPKYRNDYESRTFEGVREID